MKKHELLKYAYDNYPKGVLARFKTAPKVDHISTGKFRIIEGTGNGTCVISEDDNHCFYTSHGNEWAEIVKPKIAVKVENEKQFKALMKYYDSLGWKWKDGCDPLHSSGEYQSSDTNLLAFNDKFNHLGTNKYPIGDYQIIPFADFAEEKGIKLPHITTHDGVDLYIGDYVACVWEDNGEWKLTHEYTSMDRNTVTGAGQRNLEGERKLFSTKQAALSWIDAQKPKNVIISPDSSYPIIVYRNPVCGNEYIHLDMSKRGDYNGANIHLTIHELRQALKAYDEMHS